MRIGKEKEVYKAPERIFTDSELQKFHEDIQKYRVTNKLTNNEEVFFVDFTLVHKGYRTMNKDGAVYIQEDGFGSYVYPTRYERLENKIRQYINFRGRKEFFDKNKLEGLDKLAEEMSVGQDITVDDIPF